MHNVYLQIYHRLPWHARNVVASLRGSYLRRWRYGVETERLVEEALEREHWGFNRWKNWQEERLAFVLHRAASRVPYYREQWIARRRKGDHSSWQYLENWPTLEKESLRQNQTAFVADDCNIRKMFHEHTSGTTGKALDLWWSRKTVQMWYALFEARWRRWYGISREDRWAILGGQLITSIADRQPPFWVWNAPLKQLYMSSYHLAPNLIPYYLDALKKYRIKYIFGYSSSLNTLAQEILRLERKDLQMAVAITNAEPLLVDQRWSISEAFQCPVRETYGMAEIVAAASECNREQLHLWPEVGWVEVFDNDQLVDNGTPGELVCTGLLNTDMPLIRYRVGDRGALRPTTDCCACERGLPKLASLEGRIDDVLYTTDGRRIGRLDPVFKDRLPVREAQIIQEALDRVRLRYVPAMDFKPDMARLMVQRLQERMGAVEVLLERMDEIPRDHNGKFRSVICQLPAEEKSL
jgi:phenylacetate-CoA ligase